MVLKRLSLKLLFSSTTFLKTKTLKHSGSSSTTLRSILRKDRLLEASKCTFSINKMLTLPFLSSRIQHQIALRMSHWQSTRNRRIMRRKQMRILQDWNGRRRKVQERQKEKKMTKVSHKSCEKFIGDNCVNN